MNQQQQSYLDSHMYEAFMKRAHRSDRNFSKGIDNSVFLLLYHIDNGYYGKPKDYSKQVVKIKGYLAKAVEKVLKWKLNDDELRKVKVYATQVQLADGEDGLAEAIDGLLRATQRFKEYH